jgi:hypothetical protein
MSAHLPTKFVKITKEFSVCNKSSDIATVASTLAIADINLNREKAPRIASLPESLSHAPKDF